MHCTIFHILAHYVNSLENFVDREGGALCLLSLKGVVRDKGVAQDEIQATTTPGIIQMYSGVQNFLHAYRISNVKCCFTPFHAK